MKESAALHPEGVITSQRQGQLTRWTRAALRGEAAADVDDVRALIVRLRREHDAARERNRT